MARWKEDKIGEWEDIFFNKRLSINEYNYIAKEEPGFMILLLHIWDTKKYNNDASRQWKNKTYDNSITNMRLGGNKKRPSRKKFMDDVDKQAEKEYKKEHKKDNH